MIVILCEDFYEAMNAFKIFVRCIEDLGIVKKIYKGTECVETDDDLKYIFIDYRMRKNFVEFTEDFIDESDFFEDFDLCFGGRGI